MSSGVSVPVQLSQPQFPVKHGTVLYQLLESSSKESSRCSSRINIRPSPPTPPFMKRRSNIPVPIGRNSGSNESDTQNYRRFKHCSKESGEQTHVIYACRPVESRKFEESLRKYDNETSNRSSRSAPTSRLPSPIGRRPATTITAEARKTLSRSRLSSYRDNFDRQEVQREQEKAKKPPALPIGRVTMKHMDCQTDRESKKTIVDVSTDIQTDLQPEKVENIEPEFDGNNNHVKKVYQETATQLDEDESNDSDRIYYEKLLKEKDALLSQLTIQLEDKMSECNSLQVDVNSLNAQLDSIMSINVILQNKLLNPTKPEVESKNAGGDSQTVCVQTESLEVFKLCLDKSTLTEEIFPDVSPFNPPNPECVREEIQEVKLCPRSPIAAAKDWMDSSSPPFDFSSVNCFPTEQFMKSPSCTDATLSTFKFVLPRPTGQPEPDQQVVMHDGESMQERNLHVLKPAKSQAHEMGSQSNVHTRKFIDRLMRRKDQLSRRDGEENNMNELNLNPGEPCSRKRSTSTTKSKSRKKTVSFDEETVADSQEIGKVGHRSRSQRSKDRSSRHSKSQRDSEYAQDIQNGNNLKDANNSTGSSNGWTPEVARRKEQMINEVFNALHLSPKAKVGAVCETLASHVIAIGGTFAGSQPDEEPARSPERPRPRPRRRDLARRSPTTCLFKKW